MVASLVIQKVQLTTLIITSLLTFQRIFYFTVYFFLNIISHSFFIIFFLPTLNQRENKHIYKIIHKK